VHDLRILRALTGWPEAVPDDLLYAHMDEALREAQALTGLAEAPDDGADAWASGVAWLAAASALPSLHTFALSGAAKVGRLEGSVEFRFLTPDQVAAQVAIWEGKGRSLLMRLAAGETDADSDGDGIADSVTAGPAWMGAV
jgi:hypothetical protein